MGLILSYQERVERILNSSCVVTTEDSSVFRVSSVELLGSIIFVNCGGGTLFQDTEVFTLEEYSNAKRALINIKNKLDIR